MAQKSAKLAVRPNDKEQIWGLFYLLLSFLLPTLLAMLNGMLPTPLNRVWFNFLYFTVNFLCVLFLFHSFFKRALMHAGTHFWFFLLATLAGTAVYGLCNWGLSLLYAQFAPDFSNLNDGSIAAMAQNNFWIMFVGTVIFVPVAEETLHRGLIFGSLYPKNHFAAYIFSAVVFAAVHLINYIGSYSLPHLLLAFVQYLPAGLVLAGVYRISGSIFAPIVVHAVINAVALIQLR